MNLPVPAVAFPPRVPAPGRCSDIAIGFSGDPSPFIGAGGCVSRRGRAGARGDAQDVAIGFSGDPIPSRCRRLRFRYGRRPRGDAQNVAIGFSGDPIPFSMRSGAATKRNS